MDQTRRKLHTGWWLLLAAIVVLTGIAFAIMWRPALAPQATPPSFDQARIERGANLAHLGMCASCHTADLARPFAGGKPMETPFGTVHSTNITPDADTGIGAWSPEVFTRAMREGVSRDGHRLYPAFPYNHYMRMTQDDIDDLYAYFMTRTPIAEPAPANDMTFPFGFRPLVGFWNVLYLDDAPWRPDPRQSAEWNRGAYLADAVAHCAACHTPRTKLGGPDIKRQLDGGEAEGWYAPALNRNSPSPLPWTREELQAYLRTGMAEDHAVAGGPMQDVVMHLAQADEGDVAALAAWTLSHLSQAPLRTTPAQRDGALPEPTADDPELPRMRLGYELYANSCARCHDVGRAPSSGTALPLQKAIALYDPDPRSLIHIVDTGILPPDGEPGRWMPGFEAILSDEQAGALAAYLRKYGAGQPAWPQLDEQVSKARAP
ncbi:cytochrome c [Massilia sp. CFBP9012]|uniref:c-type cytochrome n=1 Tax=Massilia sp. CFBP9012 TaxID=3096531 RepID=UPI002A6B1879|nr:cytochrome c [Massilia sp. CFBP9012]MDY0977973.1 cytochrome c [Massilia sp. CFBP9012]